MYINAGSKWLLPFAYDIVFVGRSLINIKENLIKMDKETIKIGLKINENNFLKMNNFKCLGTIIKDKNKITEVVNARIQSGKILRWNQIARGARILMYKSILKPRIFYLFSKYTVYQTNPKLDRTKHKRYKYN